jgi:hypothetical protein
VIRRYRIPMRSVKFKVDKPVSDHYIRAA